MITKLYNAYIMWRCRRDPVFFFERVAGIELRPYQKEMMRRLHKQK